MDKEDVDEACSRSRVKAAARLEAALGSEAVEGDGRSLEVACWNWSLRRAREKLVPRHWDNRVMRQLYVQKVLSVEHNARYSPDIARKVCGGQMSPLQLVEAHPHALHPELWEKAYLAAERTQAKKEARLDAQGAADGAFVCKKCKSKKTTYRMVGTNPLCCQARPCCRAGTDAAGPTNTPAGADQVRRRAHARVRNLPQLPQSMEDGIVTRTRQSTDIGEVDPLLGADPDSTRPHLAASTISKNALNAISAAYRLSGATLSGCRCRQPCL